MGELRGESGPHSLARVHERVDEDDFLQDGKRFQRAPRVVGAAEEDHRGHHHAEHEPDMLLIEAAAQG